MIGKIHDITNEGSREKLNFLHKFSVTSNNFQYFVCKRFILPKGSKVLDDILLKHVTAQTYEGKNCEDDISRGSECVRDCV